MRVKQDTLTVKSGFHPKIDKILENIMQNNQDLVYQLQ